MSLLDITLEKAAKRMKAPAKKKPDLLVQAMQEFLDAETAEEKADAFRAAMQFAEAPTED